MKKYIVFIILLFNVAKSFADVQNDHFNYNIILEKAVDPVSEHLIRVQNWQTQAQVYDFDHELQNQIQLSYERHSRENEPILEEIQKLLSPYGLEYGTDAGLQSNQKMQKKYVETFNLVKIFSEIQNTIDEHNLYSLLKLTMLWQAIASCEKAQMTLNDLRKKVLEQKVIYCDQKEKNEPIFDEIKAIYLSIKMIRDGSIHGLTLPDPGHISHEQVQAEYANVVRIGLEYHTSWSEVKQLYNKNKKHLPSHFTLHSPNFFGSLQKFNKIRAKIADLTAEDQSHRVQKFRLSYQSLKNKINDQCYISPELYNNASCHVKKMQETLLLRYLDTTDDFFEESQSLLQKIDQNIQCNQWNTINGINENTMKYRSLATFGYAKNKLEVPANLNTTNFSMYVQQAHKNKDNAKWAAGSTVVAGLSAATAITGFIVHNYFKNK